MMLLCESITMAAEGLVNTHCYSSRKQRGSISSSSQFIAACSSCPVELGLLSTSSRAAGGEGARKANEATVAAMTARKPEALVTLLSKVLAAALASAVCSTATVNPVG